MKLRYILALFIMFSFVFQNSLNFAEKLTVLDEVLKPEKFAVGNGYIYVLEKTTIHIYDQKTYKYVGKFGKQGEGPREIKKNMFGAPIGVIPHRGKVIITSSAKVSFFTATGKYIREQRVAQFDNFYPFGDRYICISQAEKKGNDATRVLALFIADKDLKKGKVIYKSDFEVGMNFKWEFPITPFYPSATDNKVFVIDGRNGFAINIYDKAGNKTGRIFKKVEKIKIPDSFRKKTIKWFKTNPNYKKAWDFFKTKIAFKKYYPPIHNMFANNNKLYIFTNTMKDDLRECIITDFNGKEIKRKFLYSPENYGMDFKFMADLENNYYYWIVENEDDETWELYKENIE